MRTNIVDLKNDDVKKLTMLYLENTNTIQAMTPEEFTIKFIDTFEKICKTYVVEREKITGKY